MNARIARALATALTTIACTALLAACGGKEKPARHDAGGGTSGGASAPAAGTPANGTAPAAAPTGEKIAIKSADGHRVMEVSVQGSDVMIEIGDAGAGRMLVGRMRESGKRKYAFQNGAPVAEVAADDDAFKVRSLDGKLLWKVKLKDDKVKISDNEENAHPYVLKPDEDGVKVKMGEEETELGKAKFNADNGKVKVKNAAGTEMFEAETTNRSSMYGVLLLTKIGETERAIIMGELLARGR